MVRSELGTVGFLLTALVAWVVPRDAVGSAPATAEHEALLRKADVGSAAPPSFRAVLLLTPQGRPEAAQLEVWRSSDERTLVRFLDPRERGKYLLYTEGELWFLAPGAQKPVKLPPSFRIRGAATLDDILGRHYSRDYRIRSVGESSQSGHGRVTFDLEPRAEKAPFASILYVVDAASARPERAEFRLRSGRLATVLEFDEWSPGARLVPRRFTLRDALRGGSAIEVEVVRLEAREVPAGLFDRQDGSERRRLETEPRP